MMVLMAVLEMVLMGKGWKLGAIGRSELVTKQLDSVGV